MNGERKVAILGDMKELGNKEVMLHGEVGFYINDRPVDVLITVGQLAKTIGECASSVEVHHFDTLEQILEEIDTILHKNDTILVKASHSMHFEKITELLKTL